MEMLALMLIAIIVQYWQYILPIGAGIVVIYKLVRFIKDSRVQRRNKLNAKLIEMQSRSTPDSLMPFLKSIDEAGTKDNKYIGFCKNYEHHRASLRKEVELLNRKAEENGINIHLDVPA